MKLEILTPESVVFTGENVTLVQLPGIDGSFEIMNDHAPLISVLKQGDIKVLTKDGNPQFFSIKGGVIEVLNKRNGAPFIQADQELLTAFTSQATIAIENARLYNMTDQALADRVDGLIDDRLDVA